MAKCIVFTADGQVIQKQNDALEDLQSGVEGYIEIGFQTERHIYWVNEDGRLKNLPQNKFYPAFFGNVVMQEKERINDESTFQLQKAN